MGLDASNDEASILDRLRTWLWSGRIYEDMPDEQDLEVDTATGLVLPYGIVTFGVLFPSAEGRTIVGEAMQPHVLPFVVEMWGPTKNDAKAGAYGVIKCLTGFRSSENASEITLGGGGGGFSNFDQGRPVRFMRPVTASCIINMQTDDTDDALAP